MMGCDGMPKMVVVGIRNYGIVETWDRELFVIMGYMFVIFLFFLFGRIFPFLHCFPELHFGLVAKLVRFNGFSHME